MNVKEALIQENIDLKKELHKSKKRQLLFICIS